MTNLVKLAILGDTELAPCRPPTATARAPPRVPREAISLYQAKTHLSSLVERASAGEEIIIMKSGRARARLVAMQDGRAARVAGRGKGAWRVSADFDAPLPDDLLDAFDGTG